MWPFKRKTNVSEPVDWIITDDEMIPDFQELSSEWEFDASIPPRRLAALYLENGWPMQIGDSFGFPLPGGIVSFLKTHVSEIAADDEIAYREAGRLLFLKDDLSPDTVHVYLFAGTASRQLEDKEVSA